MTCKRMLMMHGFKHANLVWVTLLKKKQSLGLNFNMPLDMLGMKI